MSIKILPLNFKTNANNIVSFKQYSTKQEDDEIADINNTGKLPEDKCLVFVPSNYVYQWPGVAVKIEAFYSLEDRELVEKIAQYDKNTKILYELPPNVKLERDFLGKIIGKINDKQ